MQIPNFISALLARFDQAGEEAYLVGGCLRDALLGIPPHDFDITTSALPARTGEICADLRVIETGIQHGTVTVITEGNPVEITTFRIDGAYNDSRHPESVRFASRVSEDLSRRDFTVNAMAYHPDRGLVDLFGGKEDLERRIIRAVGDPALRFREDALRILRAFRFSAQLSFSIHEDTLAGAAREKEGLARIAKERIASEFLRLLTSPSPEQPLRLMAEHGILPYIVGGYCPSNRTLSLLPDTPPTADARLGLFFAEASSDTARACLRDLKCSNRTVTGALAVLRGSVFPINAPADAGRFRAATGDYAMDAIRVAVLLGNAPSSAIAWIEQSLAPCKIADLAISGRDLMALGYAGKEVGTALSALLAAAMDDPTLNQKESLLQMATKLRQKGTDPQE